MTILIMCQGEQRRLAHLGHPKQLLIVDGETILARTLRLCHETALAHDPITFGRVPHIYVVGNDQRLNAVAVTHRAFVISLEAPGFCVLDGIEATKPAWPVMDDRRIHVLLGDVVWSRESLVSLLADPRPLVFAGTSDVSASTGEIFGMSFTDRELVADLLATAPCRVRGPRQAQRQ